MKKNTFVNINLNSFAMKKSTIILTWGMGTSIISIIYSQILYAMGMENSGLREISFLIIFFGLFIGTLMVRNKVNGGYLTYGEGFKAGFLMSLIITILGIIALSVDLQIHKDMIDRIIEARQIDMINSGVPPDQLEMRMNFVRHITTPKWMIIGGFVFFLVLNTIFSLVTAGLCTRKKPIFDDTEEVANTETNN